MVRIQKWPSTGPSKPVEAGSTSTHIEPMDPLKLPFGESWIVDFNNPKTLELINELSQRPTILI